MNHLKEQSKLNRRHAKWIEFIETFSYVIKYKQGKDNVVADALSGRYNLFTSLSAKILGFEHVKELYRDETDFGMIYSSCLDGKVVDDYYVFRDFLFKKSKFCVPKCSVRELLVKEAHGGGLMGHFGIHKTYDMLHEYFFWSKMKHDVHNICSQCFKCKEAKSRSQPNGLHTPLILECA